MNSPIGGVPCNSSNLVDSEDNSTLCQIGEDSWQNLALRHTNTFYRRSPLELLECLLQMKQMVRSHTRRNHGQVHLERSSAKTIDCVP